MRWGVFVAIVFGLLFVGSLLFFVLSGDSFFLGSGDESVVGVSFPLRFRSVVPSELSFVLVNGSGYRLDSGLLRVGVVEEYRSAVFNRSYLVHAWRDGVFYHEPVDCRQVLESDLCDIRPSRIAEVDFFVDGNEVVLDLDDDVGGLLRQVLVCVSWRYPVLNVRFPGLSSFGVPDRLVHRVDRCFFVGDVVRDERLFFELLSDERVGNEVVFYLVDKGVDEDFVYTYEVDSGLKDLSFVYSS